MNLIGEHTDYNSGFVLPIAINLRTYVAAAPRNDGVLRGWSLQEAETFEVEVARLTPAGVTGWPAYACGPAWVLAQRGWSLPGADLLVDSQIPLGAGLSSSAAIQTAIGLALSDLAGRPLEGRDLADVAHRSESDFVGVPSGTMDQMISALGRRSTALFLDTKDASYEYIPFDLMAGRRALLVIDTGVKHRLRDGQYAERRRTCEAAAAALGVPSLREATLELLESGVLTEVQRRRARHVVTENHRVLEVVAALRAADLRLVGSAFVRSHESLRRDYEVSSPELDLAVESALAAGALGARMTGGGFGGSAITLVEAVDVATLRRHVIGAFDTAGFGKPRVFEVHAEDGATAHR